MSTMFPAYKRHKALPFRPPPAIRRLPINLLRTNLVTRAPHKTQSAMEQYFAYMGGAPMPPLMPQRMLFQQWKKLPGGMNRGGYADFTRSATSVSRAMHASHVPNSTVHRVTQPQTYDKVMAAMSRGGAMMPQPVTDHGLPPIARTEPRGLRYRLEPPPEAFIAAVQGAQQLHGQDRASACNRAMQQAAGVRARMVRMVRR
jgi:hypothetical protein